VTAVHAGQWKLMKGCFGEIRNDLFRRMDSTKHISIDECSPLGGLIQGFVDDIWTPLRPCAKTFNKFKSWSL
jgi:hypothetical protein